MKLVILGDSHVVSLGRAYANRSPDRSSSGSPETRDMDVRVTKLMPFPFFVKPFFSASETEVRFENDVAVKALNESMGSAIIRKDEGTVYGFSLAYSTSLLIWSPMWMSHMPWRVCVPKWHALSDQAVEAIALDHFQYIFAFFEHLKKLGVNFFLIESPPPRGDDPIVRKRKDIVLEVDRLAREAIHRRLTTAGIDTVFCPVDLYDGERRRSVLKDEYCLKKDRDTHHANTAAGEIYLDAVVEHFRKTYCAAAP